MFCTMPATPENDTRQLLQKVSAKCPVRNGTICDVQRISHIVFAVNIKSIFFQNFFQLTSIYKK